MGIMEVERKEEEKGGEGGGGGGGEEEKWRIRGVIKKLGASRSHMKCFPSVIDKLK